LNIFKQYHVKGKIHFHGTRKTFFSKKEVPYTFHLIISKGFIATNMKEVEDKAIDYFFRYIDDQKEKLRLNNLSMYKPYKGLIIADRCLSNPKYSKRFISLEECTFYISEIRETLDYTKAPVEVCQRFLTAEQYRQVIKGR
jgi:hypothetical protein